jgi:hypothetical protein
MARNKPGGAAEFDNEEESNGMDGRRGEGRSGMNDTLITLAWEQLLSTEQYRMHFNISLLNAIIADSIVADACVLPEPSPLPAAPASNTTDGELPSSSPAAPIVASPSPAETILSLSRACVGVLLNATLTLRIPPLSLLLVPQQQPKPSDFESFTSLLYQPAAASPSKSENDIAGLNRYRDNDELRFSFRSLEKYAPWIRQIFLVTNGQVPAWLDVNHPRVTVVTHEEIFADKSLLPVFSSPAIEVHLHRIPGLSERFIYFNDDVMLGSEVWPDDFLLRKGGSDYFLSKSLGQKVYLSWEVPKCNPGCIDAWLGDGYCDVACNTTRCMWDAGDCNNGTVQMRGTYNKGRYDLSKGTGGHTSSSTNTPTIVHSDGCADGCPDTWLGDRMCDVKCSSAACGWDAGDCGVELVRNSFTGSQPLVQSAYHNATGLAGCNNAWMQQFSVAVMTDLATAHMQRLQSRCVERNDTDDCTTSLPAANSIPAGEVWGGEGSDVLTNLLQPASITLSALMTQVSTLPAASFPFYDAALGQWDTQGVRNGSFSWLPLLSPLLRFNSTAAALANAAATQVDDNVTIAGEGSATPNNAVQQPAESLVFDVFPQLETMQPKPSYTVYVNMSDILKDATDATVAELLLRYGWLYGIAVSGKHVAANESILLAQLPNASDIILACFNTTLASQVNVCVQPSDLAAVQVNTEVTSAEASAPSRVHKDAIRAVVYHAHATTIVTVLRAHVFMDDSTVSRTIAAEQICGGNVSHPLCSATSEQLSNSTQLLDLVLPYIHAVPVEETSIFFKVKVTVTLQVQCPPLEEAHALAGCANRSINVDGVVETPLYREVQLIGTREVEVPIQWILPSIIANITSAPSRVAPSAKRIKPAKMASASPKPHPSSPKAATKASIQQRKLHIDTSDEPVLTPLSAFSSEALGRLAAAAHIRALDSSMDVEGRGEEMIAEAWAMLVDAALPNEGTDIKNNTNGTIEEVVDTLYEPASVRDSGKQKGGEGRGTGARRLEESSDTYGDSLIFSNRLMTQAFGRRTRKAPAHMPHMIDKAVMSRLQAKFPAEFAATASHRFRSSRDVQYAFSYFYFLIEGGHRMGIDLSVYWYRELDTDMDGWLNDNEFRTLAAVVYKKSPTQAELVSLRDCIAPEEVESSVITHQSANGDTTQVEHRVKLTPAVTIERVMECEAAVNGLSKNVRDVPTHQEVPLDEVAFEMITDDFNKTLSQLDSVRARKTKFICINDDMKEAPLATQRILREYFESQFPFPSSFEVPDDALNPHLYITPLREWSRKRGIIHLFITVVVGMSAACMLAVVARIWCRKPNRKTRLRTNETDNNTAISHSPHIRKAD